MSKECGQRLAQAKHGDKKALAAELDVSVRTLLNWEKKAGQEPKKPGRPSYSLEFLAAVRLAVRKALKEIGWTAGWRSVAKELPHLPVGLIQKGLRVIKHRYRRLQRFMAEKRRQGWVVHAKDALVSQDSSHIAGKHLEKTWGEVAVDHGTHKGGVLGGGAAATGQDMLGWIEGKRSAGKLPLVYAVDNGPANVATQVKERLRQLKVVVLYNRPHTPQDNARVERFIGEAKAEACLGSGMWFNRPIDALARLKAGIDRLNRRPRLTLGGLSADQAELVMPSWQAFTSREGFYEKVCSAVAEAVQGVRSKRQQRRLERQAILRTMCELGLITLTRGSLSSRAVKTEIVS